PAQPPRPRSPPPPPDERSRASLTFRVRPCRSLPLNSAIAFCASLAELISTKPKPRDCPVARSVMTATDSHVPAWENSASRSLLVVSKERLPTKIFLPISRSSPLGAVLGFCRGCLGEKPTSNTARSRTNKRTDFPYHRYPVSCKRATHGVSRTSVSPANTPTYAVEPSGPSVTGAKLLLWPRPVPTSRFQSVTPVLKLIAVRYQASVLPGPGSFVEAYMRPSA